MNVSRDLTGFLNLPPLLSCSASRCGHLWCLWESLSRISERSLFHGCSGGGFHRRRKPAPERVAAPSARRVRFSPNTVRASFRSLSCCGLDPPCVGSGAGFGARRSAADASVSPRLRPSWVAARRVGIVVLSGLVPGGSSWSNNGRRVVLLTRFRRSNLRGQEGLADHSSRPEGLSSSFLRTRLRTCCVVPVEPR